jgi:glycosyltransferase involved in cell wall biosynthesis
VRGLVVIPGPLGDRLSAPEVRGWNIALELARRHDISVAAPGAARTERQEIAVIPSERRQLIAAARDADFVIAPWVPPYLYAALWRKDTLFVADMYNPVDVELANGGHGRPARALLGSMRANDRLQLACADLVLCAVQAQARRLSNQIREGRHGLRPLLRVVPFGVDNEPPPAPRRQPIRERFPAIRSDDVIVLWWGNVWPWFDFETALRAFREVARSRPHVKLVVTGGRPPREEARALDRTGIARDMAASMGLLGESVHFVDEWVPQTERHEYLQEADVGLTLHRDTPEKELAARGRYMDYLWAGLPCVLGAGDELADRFAAAEFASIAPPGDVDAAASALSRLVDDAELRRRAAAAAENLVPRLRWSAAVEPLLDALDDLAGSKTVRAGARSRLVVRLADFYARRAAHKATAAVGSA